MRPQQVSAAPSCREARTPAAQRPSPLESQSSICSASDQGPRDLYGHLLSVAGEQLSTGPLHHLTLPGLARASGVPEAQVRQHFASVRDVGAAALDHERSAMAAIQHHVQQSGQGPLDQIASAFHLVGVGLQRDVLMRAGVRLALESKAAFPERRLEPRRTWEGFLGERLDRARQLGLLLCDVDVQAALQVRDSLVRYQTWSSAAAQMGQVGQRLLLSLRGSSSDATNLMTGQP